METATLVIKVDSSGADRATRSLDKLDRAAGKNERAAGRLTKQWAAAAAGLAVIGGYAAARATGAFLRQADAFATMTARLGLVTNSTDELHAAQRRLFAQAQESGQSLEAVTELYTKLGQASDDLRNNQKLLGDVTETVGKTLAIAGADANTSAAVIRQFAQAMGAGALRGDELISVMEGAPPLVRAIADGMGVTVGELRKLGQEGKLTSEVVLPALVSQMGKVDAQFHKLPLTISRATQQVKNALTQMVGETDQAEGASRDLAESIAELARLMESQEVKDGFATLVGGMVTIAKATATAASEFANFSKWLGESLAAAVHGPADDDMIRLENRVSKLKRELAQLDQVQMVGGQVPASYNPLTGEGAGRFNKSGYASDARQEYLREYARLRAAQIAAETRAVDEYFKNKAANPTAAELGVGLPKRGTGNPATGTGTLDVTFSRHTYDMAAATADLTAQVEAHTRAMMLQEDAQLDGARARVEQKHATEALLEDMRFELDLLGMSNVEQEKAIALRQAGVSAASAYGQAIAEMVGRLDQARATRRLMDDLRGSVTDFGVTALSNYKRAGDAFEDMVERMKRAAAQMLVDRAVQWLFNWFGGLGGGASAPSRGFAASFGNNTGWLSGGGFGTGGGVPSLATGGGQMRAIGGMGWTGENGVETFVETVPAPMPIAFKEAMCLR